MLPKLLLPAVISVFLLTTTTSSTKTTTTTATAKGRPTTAAAVGPVLHSAETTTSLLPLQPPLNVTSTTTSSFVHEQHQQQQQQQQPKHSITDNVTVNGDSLLTDSTKKHKLLYGYYIGGSNDSSFQQRNEYQSNAKAAGNYQVQLPDGEAKTEVEYTADETGYHPVVRYESKTNHSSVSGHFSMGVNAPQNNTEIHNSKNPNAQGYIQFELNYDDSENPELVERRRNDKAETVSEVLSNLFPNGFSDIFRFSYNGESTTTTSTTEKPMKATTWPVFKGSPFNRTHTTTTATPHTTKSEPYFRYETSITKEYRREVRPGHTEIVVEKIGRRPSSSEEFKDGSNLITKDDLLRINRAAVGASVLPSLLVEPNKANATEEQTLLTMHGPIVILNDNDAEVEESTEDDNQIAESQNIAQHVYQRLPDTINPYPYKDEGRNYKPQRGGQSQEINVQIIHDETLAKSQAEAYNQKLFTPTDELREHSGPAAPGNAPLEDPSGSRGLDHFQEHTEHTFKQRNSVQEAPSRKFLKHFNPALSESANGPIPKGNFHYEVNSPRAVIHHGDYSEPYVKPAAQLQYQQEQQQYQQNQQQPQPQPQHPQQHPQQQYDLGGQPQPTHESSHLHTHIQHSTPTSVSSDYKGYQSTPITEHEAVTPRGLIFVTVNGKPDSPHPTAPSSAPLLGPNKPQKTPHEYVSEAAAAASHTFEQHKSPEARPKPPQGGYTFVEVQKSVNIHNKLITEKDGQLVEQHETIYPPPQYGQRIQSYQQQQQHPPVIYHPEPEAQQEHQSQPQPQTQPQHQPHDYVSLSNNPIHVQHIDSDGQHPEGAASYTHVQHVEPPPSPPQTSYHVEQPQQQEQHHHHTISYIEKVVEKPVPYPVNVEKVVPQPYPVEVEKIVDRPYPVTHVVEKKVPEPYPVREFVEKIVDRPVEVERIVERPVKVPYPVHVDHYIDRPYPVQEFIETHVPVPVPVHYDHYIDRPYPVETIVEKPMPYEVEKVVEKVVEKHVPVEVERIVEKPVEKIVEKFIDRPIGIPIRVPVLVKVPTGQASQGLSGPLGLIGSHGLSGAHGSYGLTGPHAGYLPPTSYGHPNALGWPQSAPSVSQIPEKVLQNYYTRMLKKLLPLYKTTPQAAPPQAKAPKAPQQSQPPAHHPPQKSQPAKPAPKPITVAATSQTLKPTFKISDIRFDLKPPPPPPLGPGWSKGARYIYNTLPQDMTASASGSSAPAAAQQLFIAHVGAPNEANDEFQRWRNGHSLKRSPEFGRNLHVEYGFKPPLVPSLAIDEQGNPLNTEE